MQEPCPCCAHVTLQWDMCAHATIFTREHMQTHVRNARQMHRHVHTCTDMHMRRASALALVHIYTQRNEHAHPHYTHLQGDNVSSMGVTDPMKKVWVQQHRNKWDENSMLTSQLKYLSPNARDLLDKMFDLDEKNR